MKKIYFIAASLICCSFFTCKENELLNKHEVEQELALLFNQIKLLSESTPCENAADWKYVEYGDQTCGGYIGFIYYSTKIDTIKFLKLVNNYTVKQKEFNIKWPQNPVVCIDYLVPTHIVCENGKPKGYLN